MSFVLVIFSDSADFDIAGCSVLPLKILWFLVSGVSFLAVVEDYFTGFLVVTIRASCSILKLSLHMHVM
jgi:hypothetical protein